MALVVDLRSDTVTRPTPAMRQAIFEAEVGDDVFGDDPSVIRLQDMAAEMFGKEKALFVSSGTMGNLVSIMAHCWERGQEAIVGDRSHIILYEGGSASMFGGVQMRQIRTLEDGTFDLDELDTCFRSSTNKGHEPLTGMVAIENTHCVMGGKVLPLQWIQQVSELCRRREVPLHCDGARLLNATTALNMEPCELTKWFDSVTICLSKGLGAPVGSVVVGKSDFIDKCHRMRKALGGGVRQSGFLAAAGIFALKNNVGRLKNDYRNAQRLADAFRKHPSLFTVNNVETNLVFISFLTDIITNRDFLLQCEQVTEEEKEELGGEGVSIRGSLFPGNRVRLATHLDADEYRIDMAIKKIDFVIKKSLKGQNSS